MANEWVQIVQMVWPPVISAAAVLVGVYTANRHSAKRLKLQLRDQEQRDDKKLYRQKLEAIYGLATKYEHVMGDLLANVQEHIPPSTPKSQDGALASQLRLMKEQLDPVADRLETLLNLYAPDLVTHYANARETYTSIVRKMFDLSVAPTNLKGKFGNLQKELLEASQTIRENITNLKKALCRKMAEWHAPAIRGNPEVLGHGE